MMKTFVQINAALKKADFYYACSHRYVLDGDSSFTRVYHNTGKYINVICRAGDDDATPPENVRVTQVSHAKLGRTRIFWVPGSIVRF